MDTEKLKKYYGLLIFIAIVVVVCYLAYNTINPKYNESIALDNNVDKQENLLKKRKIEMQNVKNKLQKLQDAINTSQKRIYAPLESDLGNDTLFFTLYQDIIEMIHSHSIKIKSLDYYYNPEQDTFVESGKDAYFVCDVEMELVSNYVNLGKLVEDLYKYPYYIKINSLDVLPYKKDKKVLLSKLNLVLYARTAPDPLADQGAQ